jgi:hypothetical protein
MKAELGRASRHLLRPLVRLLLRHGIAFGEFSDIARSVYVEVAREDFSLPGKKSTDSRVAILTGLTRKDVRALRERQHDDAERPAHANRATRVLSGWYQDADFCGADGAPSPLPLEEARGASFAALVKRYSGDMPPRAMLEELLRVKAVSLESSGEVHVLSRSYVPVTGDPEGARMFGTALHDLAGTLDHNLSRRDGEPARFQRTVFSHAVPLKQLPVLQRIVAERGQRFLEALDDWLSAHEVDPARRRSDEPGAARTGVGVYFFQDDPPPRKDKS